MRKNYLIILLLTFIFASGQNIEFTDLHFKEALTSVYAGNPYGYTARDANGNPMTIDTNEDQEIQASEAIAVYELYLYRPNSSYPFITNLSGINYFTNLRKLYCPEQHIGALDLTALLHLEELECQSNLISSLNVSGLQNLIKVKCNVNSMNVLSVTGCTNLEILEAVGNNLSVLDVSTLSNLTTLNVNYNNLTVLNVSALSNLQIVNCEENNITALDLSGLNNLTDIYCGHNQITNLNLSGLESLQVLSCFDNQITDLNITEVPNITSLICSANPLQALDLSVAQNLISVWCEGNDLTELNVTGLTSLYELYCGYNQLQSLDFSSCSNLFYLQVLNNPLQHLNLKNGHFQQSVMISNNPGLQYICVDEGQEQNMMQLIVNNQLPGCIVNSYCSFAPGGEFFTFTGSTSFSASGDCTTNTPLPLQSVNVSDGSNSGMFMTTSSGSFSVPVAGGTYTFSPVNPNPVYYTISPENITVNFPGDISPYLQNFCLVPAGLYNDLEVKLIPTTPARPGFDSSYRIICVNKGTTTISGSVVFTFLGDLMDYVSSSVTPNVFEANSLTWNFSDLEPFGEYSIDVTMNINSPAENPPVNIDNQLDFSTTVSPVEGDSDISNNTFAFKQIVVGSYDPNDKTCLEGKSIPYEMVGEYVHYVIRFENTGNYPAENIVVKDIIDSNKFDINSLVPYQSSHPVVTRINGNTAEFIFEAIMLPGIPSEDRHGFIAFKIKTKASLMPYESFSNSAAIYFDFNLPVITNIAETLIIGELGINNLQTSNDVILYPNPAGNSITIKSNGRQQISSLEIYDIIGQKIVTRDASESETSINISSLNAGTYFVRVNSDNGASYVQFIKQ